MERDQGAMTEAEREEANRLAAEQQGATLPDAGGVAGGVLEVLDGALSAIATVHILTEVAGAVPKVASEGMEVIGNIGEALGDVLDFDF